MPSKNNFDLSDKLMGVFSQKVNVFFDFDSTLVDGFTRHIYDILKNRTEIKKEIFKSVPFNFLDLLSYEFRVKFWNELMVNHINTLEEILEKEGNELIKSHEIPYAQELINLIKKYHSKVYLLSQNHPLILNYAKDYFNFDSFIHYSDPKMIESLVKSQIVFGDKFFMKYIRKFDFKPSILFVLQKPSKKDNDSRIVHNSEFNNSKMCIFYLYGNYYALYDYLKHINIKTTKYHKQDK